jgi:uncharacterized protein (DUF952 family)
VTRTVIYHITTVAAWEEARRTGAYTADSLFSEGFIHCSDRDQYVWVANTRFRGRRDLILLYILEDRLRAPVVRENLEGGQALFPHIYGPLHTDAVLGISIMTPADDGSFDHLADVADTFRAESIDTPYRGE